MFWFFIAIIGYTAQSLVFVLDKIILSKSLGKPVVYTFYSTIYFTWLNFARHKISWLPYKNLLLYL